MTNQQTACVTCSDPYPCPCIACPRCDKPAPKGELGHECACGWREDDCEDCGARMVFDAEQRGVTCGGLSLVGWMACPNCKQFMICEKSKPADAVDWRLAKGGRSVTCGGIKVRAEAGDAEVIADTMARIVRVPDLELEVERLRDLLKKFSLESA